MATTKDYYGILGLPRNATDEQVKRLSASWPWNITPTATAVRRQMKGLRR